MVRVLAWTVSISTFQGDSYDLYRKSGIRYHASSYVFLKDRKMKKLFTFGLAFMLSLTLYAQKKDVTKFLGIPVDGTKSAMIQKLKAKGYTYNAKLDCLEGEFNGRDVKMYVVTNNNKVWRIAIADAYSTRNEADIRVRFNTLCQQFSKNERYTQALPDADYKIDENEDISYQMSVNNKRYEASYWQTDGETVDTAGLQEWLIEEIEKTYTQSEWDEMSEEDQKVKAMILMLKYAVEIRSKKSVWFMISEQYGKYSIVMYYDNEYNHSNGEDL